MNEQLNLFAQSKQEYRIDKPIRLIELFGGIGSQAKALENLNADFERWRLCEWAVPSIRSYAAIHEGWRREKGKWEGAPMEELLKRTEGVSSDYNSPLSEDGRRRMGRNALEELCAAMDACKDYCPDVSRIHPEHLGIDGEREREHRYVLTYSFPCQDLSQAGKLAGMDRGSGTRSGLLWEVERLLGELKEAGQRPDVLLMENVPGVCGTRALNPWNDWLDRLGELGYSSYWAKVNAKDHGMPQNRVRVFMVSVLGDYGYRFPKKRRLEKRLRDFLEEDPPRRYDLSPQIINTMLYGDSKEFDRRADFEKSVEFGKSGIARTIKAKGGYDSGWTVVTECLNPKVNGKQPSLGSRVYDEDGLSTCVATSPFFMGKILVRNATKKGYLEAGEADGLDCDARMRTHRGTVQKGMAQTIKTSADIATAFGGRLRRLTPLECMRLMGFSDQDVDAMRAVGMSDSAIYHCAGDSIVVDVLMDLFGEMM